MPNGGTTRRFYSLGKALCTPDLLRQLEQRQPADCRLERPGDPLLAWVIACAALLAGDAVVCVLCTRLWAGCPPTTIFPCWGSPLFCLRPGRSGLRPAPEPLRRRPLRLLIS